MEKRDSARKETAMQETSKLKKIIRATHGFTLTELLVVIAITAILLGLLFIPIVNGFRLTRQAQNQIQAQNQARTGLDRLSRELAQASYVFDNSNTPLIIPLSFPIRQNGASTQNPSMLFNKIEFLLPIRGAGASGGIKDPTTNGPLTEGSVQFPLAPGTRMVRWFLGLRDNAKKYQNVYEFSKTHDGVPGDNGLNPLVLYRVEFNPDDPNLVNQSLPKTSFAQNGLNDPNFFYRLDPVEDRAANGKTYGENWKAAATMVVDGPNQDLLAWRKDEFGDVLKENPLRTLVTFSPSTVVGDTATPGFLTAANAEAPGAVPTLYNAQQGQWVLPCTLTFFRASSRSGATGFGQLQLRFENEIQSDGSTQLRVSKLSMASQEGALATADDGTNLYASYLRSTGQLFVKTPNVTFSVDTQRGRIQTGFVPLAGNIAGAPLLMINVPLRSINDTRPMVAGFYPGDNFGDLVPTLYRVITRDPRAGMTLPDLSVMPTNQGIAQINLWNDAPTPPRKVNATPWETIPPMMRYFAIVENPGSPILSPSPFFTFGNISATGVNPGGGLLVAPGTERVVGPELAVTSNTLALTSYYRAAEVVAGGGSPVLKKATLVVDQRGTPPQQRWSPSTGQKSYYFDQETEPHHALLRFDEPTGPGLPAKAATDGDAIAERELQVTYLWQNNYARRVGGTENGWPMDAQGNVEGEKIGITPEADVIKVDYSTRNLINISFGVHVYDTNTKRPTAVTLSDKIRVGNVQR
jgi:prepilin-type N-terminal cleavage/methylation domain-containing protein